MKILHWAFVLAVLFTNAVVVLGQTKSTATQPSRPILGGCEMNVLLLTQAHQAAGSDGSIIAIAHLGDRERSSKLNRRRLHNIRVYLTEFGWRRTPDTVIIAEGERLKGYGQVNLYVKGVFFASLAVRRNQDLLVGSCEPDSIRPVKAESNLYPYRDSKARRSIP